MKKLVLLSVLLGAMPITMMAQDDDLYFVPTKENVAKEAEKYGMPTDTYYAGSTRSADEYNRRAWSRVAPIDSAGNDITEDLPDSININVLRQTGLKDGYNITVKWGNADWQQKTYTLAKNTTATFVLNGLNGYNSNNNYYNPYGSNGYGQQYGQNMYGNGANQQYGQNMYGASGTNGAGNQQYGQNMYGTPGTNGAGNPQYGQNDYDETQILSGRNRSASSGQSWNDEYNNKDYE